MYRINFSREYEARHHISKDLDYLKTPISATSVKCPHTVDVMLDLFDLSINKEIHTYMWTMGPSIKSRIGA